ncbi:hypothetical protein CBQ26_00810 [Deinococcus indicus]|uniref:Uncharacterized protein n=2 Tax=Deinococcus indicus TaxID=223556 RepID=A0A246BTP8_9DEIO|nr:hypothetical protein CBQ26_00810 [Deinococcus indicus]
MGYVADTQDDQIGIETRTESLYIQGPGIFPYGKSTEISYDALARLLYALATAPDVREAVGDRLQVALKTVMAEHELSADQSTIEVLTGLAAPTMTIVDWAVTCEASPLQLDGQDAETGRPVYFRERWGHWSLEWWDDHQFIASGDAGRQSGSPAEQIQFRLNPFGIRLGRPKESR